MDGGRQSVLWAERGEPNLARAFYLILCFENLRRLRCDGEPGFILAETGTKDERAERLEAPALRRSDALLQYANRPIL